MADFLHLSVSNNERAGSLPKNDTEVELGLQRIQSRKSPLSPQMYFDKKSSASSSMPTMQLTWHAISAKPRREAVLMPFATSLIDRSNHQNEFRTPNKQYILDNAYGVAYPGEVLAIMGASGAGKTTLLNILTQRNLSTIKATGYIRLNGYDINKNIMRKVSAYVQQDDLFIGTMTVIEHLRFMALLRMGKRFSTQDREQIVQSVINELGLSDCANSLIGWPHRSPRGISGGERKRLAFASEIMTGPPILFCDEPTSGLDSYLAQQVISVLKDLARRKQMTVIVTIHQPPSQIFEMFDKICLLACGRIAFLGTIQKSIDFFDGLGFPLPEKFNPADHFISAISVHGTSNLQKAKARTNKICDLFLESETGQEVFQNSKEASKTPSEESSNQSSSNSSTDSLLQNKNNKSVDISKILKHTETLNTYKATWTQQFCAVFKRSFRSTLREPMFLRVRLFQSILISTLLGVIYFNTELRQSTIMNINGLIYQTTGNMNFMFQFSAVNIFSDELPIFLTEHSAGLYRADAYFLAKNAADLPQYFLYPFIFSTILYWMSGLVRQFSAYLLFVLDCISMTTTAISLGYAFACVFGDVSIAVAVMPVVVIPLLAFGGFYINQATLPAYFYPLKYLSYFGYVYEIGAINQWMRVSEIPGCQNVTSELRISVPNNLTSPNQTSPYGHCYQTGQDVLESMSFQKEHLIFNFMILLLMILSFRLIAFIALYIRAVLKK